MKKSFSIFCLLLLSLTLQSADMRFRDELDQKVYQQTTEHAKHLAQTSKSDSRIALLLKLLDHLKEKSPEAEKIRQALLFNDPLIGGADRSISLAALLKEKGIKLEDERNSYSAALAMYVISRSLNPKDKLVAEKVSAAQDNQMDINVATLLKGATRPQIYDPKKAAEDIARQIQEDLEAAQKAKSDYTAPKRDYKTKEDITKLLKAYKFTNYSYSEVGFLDAINRLQHKLYWMGVHFQVDNGKRISIINTKRAKNGALYYYGPFETPYPSEFVVNGTKTMLQILDHMEESLDLKINIVDGGVIISDG